ncbi:MAG: acyltransferase, partial [Gemmatimonadaceae bacterium]|nr:acyltransferase [Gemmatimonadaceae bacterium]
MATDGMPDDARTYRPDLDGLRALAVLAVLVHHIAPTVWPGGFAGVDVFFVLSGYLITGHIAADHDARGFVWSAFLLRRARRLLPALLVVLVATLLAGAALLTASEFTALGRQTLAALASAANVLFAREVGYFDTAAETKPLLHLWSLGVEEQFYLVWPPLLLLLARWRRARTAGAAVLALASLAIALPLATREPADAFFLLHARAWELLAGGTLALARHEGLLGAVHGARAARWSWIGAALLAAGLVAPAPHEAWPSPITLLPVAGTTLLIAAGPDAPVNRALLAWRGAVWLGLRSYPLYLWHWPLLVALRVLAPDIGLDRTTTATLAWLLGAVAVGLADLTFRVVEQPVQRAVTTAGQRGARTGRLLLPFGGALLAVAAGAAVVIRLDGMPARYAAHAADETARLARASHEAVRHSVERPSTRCVSAAETHQNSWCFRTSPRPTVAVFGDSHAYAIYGALATAQPRGAPRARADRPRRRRAHRRGRGTRAVLRERGEHRGTRRTPDPP